jgi:hypothetical protein
MNQERSHYIVTVSIVEVVPNNNNNNTTHLPVLKLDHSKYPVNITSLVGSATPNTKNPNKESGNESGFGEHHDVEPIRVEERSLGNFVSKCNDEKKMEQNLVSA